LLRIVSVKGAFWPLKRKVSNIQFDPKRLDANLLKLTKLPISIHDLKSQGLKACGKISSS